MHPVALVPGRSPTSYCCRFAAVATPGKLCALPYSRASPPDGSNTSPAIRAVLQNPPCALGQDSQSGCS
jgi:hypothetical protein